jgi:Family of unknown function (DUF6152)
MVKKLLGVIVALLVTGHSLYAHHSFAAEYDGTKPVKVTGIVKRVEWANPHIWFYVEGKDEVTGRTAVWGFSAAPPGMLARRGITKDVLKIGDTIQVEGFLAKDGSANASGGKVTFADGRQVFTASSEDSVPK